MISRSTIGRILSSSLLCGLTANAACLAASGESDREADGEVAEFQGATVPVNPLLGSLASTCTTTAPSPAAFSLPAAVAPHVAPDVTSEWWYWTGHLFTSSGERYGFHLVFFQLAVAVDANGDLVYMPIAQFSVTDSTVSDGLHVKKTEYGIPGGTYAQIPNSLALSVPAGWSATTQANGEHLSASAEGYTLELDLDDLKGPTYQDGDGLFTYGGVPWEYDFYYSRTRMKATGSLTVGGVQKPVYGAVWSDHEWGNVANGGNVIWDWYSVQLANGKELTAYYIETPDTHQELARWATLTNSDCSVETFYGAQFSMTASGSWTSPASGVEYPTSFQLAIPSKRIDLTISPVMRDQEMFDPLDPAAPFYWEGDGTVRGTDNGQGVSGVSYVELVRPPPAPPPAE